MPSKVQHNPQHRSKNFFSNASGRSGGKDSLWICGDAARVAFDDLASFGFRPFIFREIWNSA
jgi:hypothetical protein